MRLFEVFEPRSVTETIIRDFYRNSWVICEAKPQNPQNTGERNIVIRQGPDFDKTFQKISQRSSAVNKFEQFKQMKQDPMQLMTPMGANDKLFEPSGILGREIPSLRHVHITHDISLVYRIHGANPTYVDLYGFYSHDDLGTAPGGGSKKRMQQAVADRLSRHF
jgi:mRNA-degrading endonuclease YafQ of YafQ-DinJ toxin-antitoxin module